ncbi:hypothetical protein F5876DRAFT_75341 [Lentinula aff. lateritia]|uniref:Uncharacterized protein n=1 Tax=Lentinula aff. lateritia TaxID=2804960 RepID=A0ACC1U4K5_9AGAR|nr:hypothetical protein F5876DRAFT_75341 [Lentinula aff. lateritia]
MSTVNDVSNVIGEYMLKGWVLTDSPCPHCKNIPLMRSPKNQTPVVHFCANCDGDPRKVVQPSSSPSLTSTSSLSRNNPVSRSSTPATEVSDVPSSPTFALPVETPESRRRREQSDRASSEIGNRLLKGWALLGEECLNEACFGIPLVRPPKSGGEKDPRRECVICGRIYIGEGDLIEAEPPRPPAQNSSPPILPDNAIIPASNTPNADPRVTENSNQASLPLERQQPAPNSLSPSSVSVLSLVHHNFNLNIFVKPNDESTMTALRVTSHALEQTLISLSGRLTSSVAQSILIDPQTISSIVDTVSKTTQALAEVKKIQRNERVGS